MEKHTRSLDVDALAEKCGVHRATIYRAINQGVCSPKLAIAIERETNGEVSRSTLRPDLWGSRLDSAA